MKPLIRNTENKTCLLPRCATQQVLSVDPIHQSTTGKHTSTLLFLNDAEKLYNLDFFLIHTLASQASSIVNCLERHTWIMGRIRSCFNLDFKGSPQISKYFLLLHFGWKLFWSFFEFFNAKYRKWDKYASIFTYSLHSKYIGGICLTFPFFL